MSDVRSDEWDEPLPSSISPEDSEAEEQASEEVRMGMLDEMLKDYVERMAYRPILPPVARERTEFLAKPKKTTLVDNDKFFYETYDPRQRAERVKRIAKRYKAISTEQLEYMVRSQVHKEKKKENFLKKKQEIYHDLLTKLEKQCRTQYLNVLLKKFATHIAKLATTMPIPTQLCEPYCRMQRGIFCNILAAIGVQHADQAAMFYNTQAGQQFEMCHKLAHALLSLIIKALDASQTRNPADIPPQCDADFVMDNYIKDRLMCAAEKKLMKRLKPKPRAPCPPRNCTDV